MKRRSEILPTKDQRDRLRNHDKDDTYDRRAACGDVSRYGRSCRREAFLGCKLIANPLPPPWSDLVARAHRGLLIGLVALAWGGRQAEAEAQADQADQEADHRAGECRRRALVAE